MTSLMGICLVAEGTLVIPFESSLRPEEGFISLIKIIFIFSEF